MNGKRVVDIMACTLSAAVMVLSYLYIESEEVRRYVYGVGITVCIVFLLLAFMDTEGAGRKSRRIRSGSGRSGGIHTLALLDENGEEISRWNIAGRVSLLIGRDTRKEDVDINLMNTAFAGMVDRQHAVMNYTAGQWYIEDLDSANGIRIQKRDGRLYEVSKTQPCLVEKGDTVLIGLTKLAAK